MISTSEGAPQQTISARLESGMRSRPNIWKVRLKSLTSDIPATMAACFLVILIVSAIFASVIAPYDPEAQTLRLRLVPPAWLDGGSWAHPLGTDALGRDILSRLIYGGRVSLVVGLAAVTIQGVIGVFLGLMAGYRGKRVDSVIMAIADIQYALPFLVIAIAIMAVIGASFRNIIFVLGITGWVYYARLVRAETLRLKRREFVEAALVIGAPTHRVLTRHILPNVMTQVTIVASLQIAAMIIAEASLSFLGLGVPLEVPSWGAMIAEGRTYVSTAWWASAFPGLAIVITAMSVNILGDWIREEFDPALRSS